MTYTQNFSLTAAASTGPAAPAWASGTDVSGGTFNYTTPVLVEDFTSSSAVAASGGTTASFYDYAGLIAAGQLSISNSICAISGAGNGGYGVGIMSTPNTNVQGSANAGTLSTPSSHKTAGPYGRYFQYGYYEASIKFDAAVSGSSWYPCFFVIGNGLTYTASGASYLEMDTMEAESNGVPTTYFHQWWNDPGSNAHYSPGASGSDPLNPGTNHLNLSGYNTYGMLWTPGALQMFYNGVAGPQMNLVANQTVNYAGNLPAPATNPTNFPAGATTAADIIFGTGSNWPMYIDWVHVFQ